MHYDSQVRFNERTEDFDPVFSAVFGNPEIMYKDRRLTFPLMMHPELPWMLIGSEMSELLNLKYLGTRIDVPVESVTGRNVTTRAELAKVSLMLHDFVNPDASCLFVVDAAIIHEGPAFKPIAGHQGFFEYFTHEWIIDPDVGVRRVRIVPNERFLHNVANRVEGWECRCPLY